MTPERIETVVLEIGSFDIRPYEVQRQFDGWRWQRVHTFMTEPAAFARAEAVHAESGDSVRVLKVEYPT